MAARPIFLPQVCARFSVENPDLDIQIVAQPRVVNLSRREADMAITVRPPTIGQLMLQKITDYRLHLVASERFLSDHGPFETQADPAGYPVIGYIPDMICDEELGYLNELGLTRVALSSHTHLRKILPDHISLTRSFYLIRQQGDQRSDRMNRIVESLIIGLCAVVEDLEGHT